MVFPSTLIIGFEPESCQKTLETFLAGLHQKITPNNPDILFIDDYSIASVKNIKNFLFKTAYSHPNKVVIIPGAENLLPESQNALLKMIEEPGDNNYFFLITSHPGRLLPTIISRCLQIHTQSKTKNTSLAFSFPPDLKSALFQTDSLVSDKAAIIPWLQDRLAFYHQSLLAEPDPHTAAMIQKIIKALDMIDRNVDPKSALDFLFLF